MKASRLFHCLCLAIFFAGFAAADAPKDAKDDKAKDPKKEYPSAKEVSDLLAKEPFSPATWDAWRPRLLDWLNDPGEGTDPAFEAGRKFIRSLATTKGDLPEPFSKDPMAWYLLGNAYWNDQQPNADPMVELGKSQQAMRRSIQSDPKFWQARRNLARMLVQQEAITPKPDKDNTRSPLLAEALSQLTKLGEMKVDQNIFEWHFEGSEIAIKKDRYADAEDWLRHALLYANAEQAPAITHRIGQVIVHNSDYEVDGNKEKTIDNILGAIQKIVQAYPQHAEVNALYVAILGKNRDVSQAVAEIREMRARGIALNKTRYADDIRYIERTALRSQVVMAFVWIALSIAGLYALLVGATVMGGRSVERQTAGSKSLELLETPPSALVSERVIPPSKPPSSFAQSYARRVGLGPKLFRFVVVGSLIVLIAVNALLWFLLLWGLEFRISRAVLVIAVGGLSWLMLMDLFVRRRRDTFGIVKKPEDCPKLFQLVNEIAERVGTDPVKEIRITPGPEIHLDVETRGLLGLGKVERRVLVLGIASLELLSAGELKALLARELARFSKREAPAGRRLAEVRPSIDGTFLRMRQTAGWLNVFNGVYWVIYLYYQGLRWYSAGFSRSREYLADRTAAGLQGGDVLKEALLKAGADAPRFEKVMYDYLDKLLDTDEDFINVYAHQRGQKDAQNDEHITAAPWQGRPEQLLKDTIRQDARERVLGEKEIPFAVAPTLKERLDALAVLPKSENPEKEPAMGVFEEPLVIEEEVTDLVAEKLVGGQAEPSKVPSIKKK